MAACIAQNGNPPAPETLDQTIDQASNIQPEFHTVRKIALYPA
jgi:hypothetical protein